MANFGKDQLMKFGWTKGKGLGKNEDGIKEPVKLATSQNKEGIGYDPYRPWWESRYDNAVKNIKVELHDNELSLTVVNNTDDSHVNEHCDSWSTAAHPNLQSFVRAGSSEANKADQKLDETPWDTTACEATENEFILSGKLKRLVEQDKLILKDDPLLSSSLSLIKKEKSWKMNTAWTEAKRLGTDAIVLQSEEATDVRCKSTKKKSRRKMDRLMQQLASCNLEENSQDSLRNRIKFSQKMKKDREEKKISNKVSNYLQSKLRENDTKLHNKLISGYDFINDIIFYNAQKMSINRAVDVMSDNLSKLGRCGDEKTDSTEHKVDLSPELRNVIGGNGETNKRFYTDCSISINNWVTSDSRDKAEAEESLNCMVVFPSRTDRTKQDIRRINNQAKNSARYKIKYVPPEARYTNKYLKNDYQEFFFQKCNDKIGKKKNQRTKQIQKIVEKLNGDVMSNELNSIIKNLTAFGLTEEVNRNTFIKKPTQTNLMPV